MLPAKLTSLTFDYELEEPHSRECEALRMRHRTFVENLKKHLPITINNGFKSSHRNQSLNRPRRMDIRKLAEILINRWCFWIKGDENKP